MRSDFMTASDLADEYDALMAQVIAVADGCSPADWTTNCANEQRPVGVMVDHSAERVDRGREPRSADGQPVVTRHEYTLVDVFTDRKFGGNQLAVFHDGAGVSDALMQAAAKELNLTEITFVARAEHGGDHKIRIFSPTRELPFAGHPTIGTAFVLARGRDATLRLEEQVGTLQVTVRDGFIEMEQPLPTFERVADRDAVAASLALDAADFEPALPIEIGSSGLRFMFVAVKTLDAVRRASPRELAEAAYIFTTHTVEPGSTVDGRMEGQEFAGDAGAGF